MVVSYKMKQYLLNISNGKSVNYNAFVKKAQSFKITEDIIRDAFKIKKDISRKGNFYFLSVKNDSIYEHVFSKFDLSNKNKKVELSLHGNSKKAKSSFSFLLIKHNHTDIVPDAIVFNEQSYSFSFKNKLKRKLIIIENEDNFGNVIASFNNEQINLDEYNFILGFGNYISDKNFTNFLESYDLIKCFFDIDLGGLKTFSSLDSKLNTEIEFFYSDKMSRYLKLYGNKITDQSYIEVSKYKSNNKLVHVVSDILNNRKFAEQEIFQH